MISDTFLKLWKFHIWFHKKRQIPILKVPFFAQTKPKVDIIKAPVDIVHEPQERVLRVTGV